MKTPMMTNLDRRAFLKRTAQVAAAGSLGGLLAAQTSCSAAGSLPGGNMKLGLVTYQWGKDMDLKTLIDTCEKSGVLGVELRTEHAHGVEPSLSKAERLEVKKRFADSSAACLGPGTNQDYHHADPAELRENIEGTKAFLQLSHDVGGSGVKVKPNAFVEGVPNDKTIEQIGRSLNEVGKFAADLGQEIRLEVHGRETSELPVVKRIMEFAENRSVGVCWNCNDQDLNGAGLEANFDMVKGRFGQTAHVREFDVGDYPYAKLMELFVKMDYSGWVLLECRTDPADKLKAIIEQRELFERLIADGQKAV